MRRDAPAVDPTQTLLTDRESSRGDGGREDAVPATAARLELGHRIKALREAGGQKGGQKGRQEGRQGGGQGSSAGGRKSSIGLPGPHLVAVGRSVDTAGGQAGWTERCIALTQATLSGKLPASETAGRGGRIVVVGGPERAAAVYSCRFDNVVYAVARVFTAGMVEGGQGVDCLGQRVYDTKRGPERGYSHIVCTE